jgi:hypothetical protein
VLPALKRHPKEATFILNSRGANDVWHLTVFGHAVAAEEIRKALWTAGLVERWVRLWGTRYSTFERIR